MQLRHVPCPDLSGACTGVTPDADLAMSYLGLRDAGTEAPDSADPRWLEAGPPPPPAIIKAA